MLGNNNFHEFYLKNFLETHLCKHLPGDEITIKTNDGIKTIRITEVYTLQGIVTYNIKILGNDNDQFIPVSAFSIDNGLNIETPKYDEDKIY